MVIVKEHRTTLIYHQEVHPAGAVGEPIVASGTRVATCRSIWGKECQIEEEPCSLAMLNECVDGLKKGSQPTDNLLVHVHVAKARPSVGATLNINSLSIEGSHILQGCSSR